MAGNQGCLTNDPLAPASTVASQLCDCEYLPADVNTSGGVSMGKIFADLYGHQKKPASMRVALGVRARDFIELFLGQMERLALSIQA